MIQRYTVAAGRIRQELSNLEGVVERAERAVTAAHQHREDEQFFTRLGCPEPPCFLFWPRTHISPHRSQRGREHALRT
jgi:hypothetical protein